MNKTIIHPITRKGYSLSSRKGRLILDRYLHQCGGSFFSNILGNAQETLKGIGAVAETGDIMTGISAMKQFGDLAGPLKLSIDSIDSLKKTFWPRLKEDWSLLKEVFMDLQSVPMLPRFLKESDNPKTAFPIFIIFSLMVIVNKGLQSWHAVRKTGQQLGNHKEMVKSWLGFQDGDQQGGSNCKCGEKDCSNCKCGENCPCLEKMEETWNKHRKEMKEQCQIQKKELKKIWAAIHMLIETKK